MENKKLIRIIVPVLILVILAGLYVYKNVLNKPADVVTVPETPVAGSEEVKLSGGSMPLSADYELDAWLAEGKPVLIEFGTESWPFCKEMAVRLQAMHEKYGDKIIIKNVDLGQVTTAAQDFPLNFVPAQFFYNAEGKPFVPSEDLGWPLQRYFLKGTSDHALTGHVGAIPDEAFEKIVLEMIGD